MSAQFGHAAKGRIKFVLFFGAFSLEGACDSVREIHGAIRHQIAMHPDAEFFRAEFRHPRLGWLPYDYEYIEAGSPADFHD